MLNIVLIKWDDLSFVQRLMALLTVALPAHVCEENTFPGGFFYMNNLDLGTEDPYKYPQNQLSNMFTNLTGEIIYIILVLYANQIPAITVTVVIVFCLAEVVNHTRAGVKMLKLYRSKGKTTIYTPGTVTAYLVLLELSVFGIEWLTKNTFTWVDILLGVLIVFAIVVGCIVIPFVISYRVKSTRYMFTDNGYFKKFDR